ncbi:hypothetical protein CRE_29709 [Caenorhabditis remanei]|uniref:Uncharacterized protein n=1 Tax=Caenorhabditis remanei TaxID=31234 RepID=E3LVB3_CAERE|nr:hypothetical protein CRE_29709 [Caenorhabditis remanei]
MPDRNAVIAQQLAKGDVLWVPYRKDPLWPALVNNVYPKKVSYTFFPLPGGYEEPKKSRFGCAPKLTYAFVTTEPVPQHADAKLKEAHSAACSYLAQRGKTRGADIPSYGEADVKETVNIVEKKQKKDTKKDENKKLKRTRKETDSDDNEEDDEIRPIKKATTSTSDRSTPSGSQEQPKITNEQSEAMMKMINERLDALVNEIWRKREVVDCQKTLVNDKMMIILKNNQFLKESDYETVFERVVNIVRSKNQSLSLISAFNLTASHIIPHVLISCFSKIKNMDYQAAKDIFHYQKRHALGLDPTMNIPITDHLEELCRLASDEIDAIRK